MKILYLTPFDPTLKEGGGFLRSTLMWRALRCIGEVDTVVVDPCVKPCRKDKERIWSSTFQPVFSRSWRFRILQFLPLFVRRMDWAFLDRTTILERLGCQAGDYDCVVVRYEYLARRTAAWKIAPLYLDFDDLPSEAYKTIRMPKQSWITGHVRLRFERWRECFIAKRCVGVWLSNPELLKALPSSVCKKALRNIGVVPSAEYRTGARPKGIVVTVGTYGYEPNRTGLDWFLQEVWPKVSLKFHKLELHIIGLIPDYCKGLSERWAHVPGVRVLGFVEDIEKVYESALCSLAAVISGSGTCVKVIESAMFGRTVLATPFATRGLSASNQVGLGVEVFNDADEFSNCIIRLLAENATDREKRQRDIQAYASNTFSFATFRKSVADMLVQCSSEKSQESA